MTTVTTDLSVDARRAAPAVRPFDRLRTRFAATLADRRAERALRARLRAFDAAPEAMAAELTAAARRL